MGLKDRAAPVLRLKSVRPGWVLSSHHVFCFLFFIQLKINSWEPDADGNTDCEQLPRSQSEQRLASSPGNGAHMRTAVPAPDSQQGPQDSCLADPSSPMPGTSPTGHLIYVQQVFNLDRKNSQLWGKVRILNVLKHDALTKYLEVEVSVTKSIQTLEEKVLLNWSSWETFQDLPLIWNCIPLFPPVPLLIPNNLNQLLPYSSLPFLFLIVLSLSLLRCHLHFASVLASKGCGKE